jgi:hypothetical protein
LEKISKRLLKSSYRRLEKGREELQEDGKEKEREEKARDIVKANTVARRNLESRNARGAGRKADQATGPTTRERNIDFACRQFLQTST